VPALPPPSVATPLITNTVDDGITKPECGAQFRNGTAKDIEADKFEAIPYQLTRLNKLFEKAPDALLKVLRSDFDDEVRAMFVYRGVRLVRATFQNYSPELEMLLLETDTPPLR
jgi:hypothetical protein